MIAALIIIIAGLGAGLAVVGFRYRRLLRDIDRYIASIDRGTLRQHYDPPASYRTDRMSKLQTAITKILRTRTSDRDFYRDQKRYLADQLADISHQLKTPLTTQSLLIHELAQGAALGPTLRAFRSQNDRMTRLITNLLILARLDADMIALTHEPIAAGDLIAAALDHLAIAFELHGIQVRVDGTPETVLTCDRVWTAEALTNILKNAGDVTPSGGTITLTVTPGLVAHTLTVRDQGPGIPPEAMGHIFTRYYKAPSARPESTGIGLAMAQDLLARQHVTVTAANHPEGGAVFTITFYRQATL